MTGPGRVARAVDPAHDAIPEDVYGSWSGSPSPDGARVAFVSDRSGGPRVWIRAADGSLAGPTGPGEPVLTVSWSPDGLWLACVTAAVGASRTRLWVLPPDGGDARLVAGAGNATAVLGRGARHGWSADGRLLVTETGGETGGRESVALLVEPVTGEREVLGTGPLITLLDVDATGARALLRAGPRGARSLLVTEAAGTRTLTPGPGAGSCDVAALAPDGRTVYACADHGRELAALVALPADGGGAPVTLAARADAELEDLALSGDGTVAVLLWNVDGGTSALSLLDLASGRERAVPRLPRAVVHDARLGAGGGALLLTAEGWADPRGVWSVDVAGGAATPLSSPAGAELLGSRGASTATVGVDDLTRPRLLRLPARDGLELTGWLYRPAGPVAERPAAEGPWPTLVYLHGGPESQERPVYNSLFQSLVAAGVAVFAANVRGSSGFGRSFVHADDREKRHAAVDDVADCVAHLLAAGVAHPGRVACMGRSYGGWLTLAALVEFPDLFAAGVDVCGMADFATFYAGTEPWIAAAAVAEYGHPERDSALLRALSPIHRIDRLAAPLLVVHGAQDTNVPLGEAEQVVAALAARGVEHRFVLFPDEGHELLATPNRVAFVRKVVAWVTRHLAVAGAP